jgi:putative sigma-54 modulation protein
MAVDINLHARDMGISPRLREYVEKKIGKLDRYLPNLREARVDLAEEKGARSANDRHVAQVTLSVRGMVLRAEERKDDIFAAVDAVLDKMQRQIERYKGKHRNKRGDGASPEMMAEMVEEPAELPLEAEPTGGTVARRKRFALTPMNEAEAIEQMQLLGHDNFFVFYNAESNRVNVLYRRTTGDFGLIDPEIG